MARASGGRGKQAAEEPGGKSNYGVPAEEFVRAWELAGSVDEVYDALKAYSEKAGRPAMPRPIIIARAAEYRAAKVPLKKMPRVSARNIDVKSLTELVEKLRAGAPAPAAQALAPKTVPAKPSAASAPVLTREEVEEVVMEVLRREGLVGKHAPKVRGS